MHDLSEAEHYVRRSHGLHDALGITALDEVVVEPLGHGEHNANFTLSLPRTQRRYVLRINYASQMGLEKQVSYEANALRCLEPSGRTPKLLFSDDSREHLERGVLVIEYREGAHLDFRKPGMLEETARILADVHAVQPEEDCGIRAPADPLCDQLLHCGDFFSNYRASRFAQTHVIDYVERFFERTLHALEHTSCDTADCAHILNTEAVPSHFLIPDSGPGSMVDWEKPILGEVAQDVAYFLSPTTTVWDTDYVFDTEARDAFLASYWHAVDGRFGRESFDERFSAYVMSNCLLGITWSCNAWVEYHDPARPLKNERTRKLLEMYLSEDYLKQVYRSCYLCWDA